MSSAAKIWTPRRDEYYIRTGSMFENPHGVPRDEILRMIATNPAEVVAQTVFGKYVESSGLVFTGELIQNMIDHRIKVPGEAYLNKERLQAARAEMEFYKDSWVNPFHTGVDFGRQTDYTVIHTLDISTLPAQTVYWKRLNRVPWESIYEEVGRAVYYFGPNVLVDASGPAGDVIVDALMGRHYCPVHHRTPLVGGRCMRDGEVLGCEAGAYVPLSCIDGYYFSSGQGQAKKELVEHLRNTMAVGYAPDAEEAWGWIRTPNIPQLEEELTFYTWDDKRLMTDCIFALALAAWSGLEDVVGSAAVGSAYGE